MQSWMWIVCLCAAAVLLSACVSLELGIVLCLCVAVWKCAGGGEGEGKQGPSRPVASSASRAARVATNVSARASSLSPSSSSEEGKSEERRRRASPSLLSRRRPIVREALVRRVPLAAEMPVHPSEHVLDDCMLAEQRKRSVGPDARKYHSTALPNAIRAAARELTTSDPAIVPLDSDGGCARPLGEV